jgi:Glycosyltransferase family 87
MRLIARYRWIARVGDGLLVALGLAPYVLVLFLLARGGGGFGFDLHVFWKAARAIGNGHTPYDPAGLDHIRRVAQSNLSVPATDQAWAAYPPALYVLLVPFGLLPWHVAAAIVIPLLAVTPFLALRVMGVRDWRCYAAAYGSIPVADSILTGTISTLLMLGIALIWRERSTVGAGAAIIVAKLFVWPVAVAVAALDGRRRAAIMLAAAFAIAMASWAIIGFADITRYPAMLSDLSAAEAHDSFSPTGFAYAIGLAPAIGADVGIALGLVLSALAYRAGRRGERDRCFTLVIVAALLLSPIVWTHYLVLLFLPLAARYPRFNIVWLVPLGFYLGQPLAANGEVRSFLGSWPYIAIIVLASLRPRADAEVAGAAAQSMRSPGSRPPRSPQALRVRRASVSPPRAR